jgi:hypothetical protein
LLRNQPGDSKVPKVANIAAAASAKILPGNFHRAPDAPEAPQLSPARDRLRQIIASISRFQREQAEAALPAQRLRDVISEHDRRRAKLAAWHSADRQHLAERIAGGEEVMSYTSAECHAANAQVAELAEAAAAAAEALPRADADHRNAIERHAAAQAERGLAILEVMDEAVEQLAFEELATATRLQQLIQARRGLDKVLQNRGVLGDLAAAAANERQGKIVGRIIAAVPSHASAWGAAMLEGLATDPAFELAR